MYDDQQVPQSESLAKVVSRRPTVTENLTGRKENLEQELLRVNAALDLLESTPDIQKVLDSLSGLNLRL